MKESVDFSSSNLESGEYDPDEQLLTITFQSGGTYEYTNVPQAIWEGLRKASSPGGYFHRSIKLRFSGEQV